MSRLSKQENSILDWIQLRRLASGKEQSFSNFALLLFSLVFLFFLLLQSAVFFSASSFSSVTSSMSASFPSNSLSLPLPPSSFFKLLFRCVRTVEGPWFEWMQQLPSLMMKMSHSNGKRENRRQALDDVESGEEEDFSSTFSQLSTDSSFSSSSSSSLSSSSLPAAAALSSSTLSLYASQLWQAAMEHWNSSSRNRNSTDSTARDWGAGLKKKDPLSSPFARRPALPPPLTVAAAGSLSSSPSSSSSLTSLLSSSSAVVDARFLHAVLSHGTLADKVAALTLLVQVRNRCSDRQTRSEERCRSEERKGETRREKNRVTGKQIRSQPSWSTAGSASGLSALPSHHFTRRCCCAFPLFVYLQEQPLLHLSALPSLLSLCRLPNRPHSLQALEATADLFISSLLPPSRKLHFLADQLQQPQPLQTFHVETQTLMALHASSSSSSSLSSWSSSFPLLSRLLMGCFEDCLKRSYVDFMALLAAPDLLQHPLPFLRMRVLSILFRLFVSRPEAEHTLLALIVNKLSDPHKQVAAKVQTDTDTYR